MDKYEFQQWLRETARSKDHWVLDEVSLHNQGVYLIYRGGEAGYYARIENSAIEIGTYEDALPHIGEACFKPGYTSKVYPSQEAALTRLATIMGQSFLLDMLGMPVYRTAVPEWLQKLATGNEDRDARRNQKYQS